MIVRAENIDEGDTLIVGRLVGEVTAVSHRYQRSDGRPMVAVWIEHDEDPIFFAPDEDVEVEPEH